MSKVKISEISQAGFEAYLKGKHYHVDYATIDAYDWAGYQPLLDSHCNVIDVVLKDSVISKFYGKRDFVDLGIAPVYMVKSERVF